MAESQKTDEKSATTKEEYTETVNVSAVSINLIFILFKKRVIYETRCISLIVGSHDWWICPRIIW